MKTPNLGLEPILFYRKGDNEVDKFWDLLERSIIFQGVLTVGTLVLIAYLFAAGRPVPTELWAIFGLIVGFFFGSKSEQALRRRK